jgi:hypothetical protein
MTNSYQVSLRHIQRSNTVYFSSFIPSLWIHIYLSAYILLMHLSCLLPFLLLWVLIPHTCINSCWSLLSNSAHTSVTIPNSNHSNSCYSCCLMLLFVRVGVIWLGLRKEVVPKLYFVVKSDSLINTCRLSCNKRVESHITSTVSL